jgi:hypothetical protein
VDFDIIELLIRYAAFDRYCRKKQVIMGQYIRYLDLKEDWFN